MENRFAAARRRYLREYRDGIYTGMLLTGKLDDHLKEIGDTAQEMFDRLVAQMKDTEGVTERLKAENQMRLLLKSERVQVEKRRHFLQQSFSECMYTMHRQEAGRLKY